MRDFSGFIPKPYIGAFFQAPVELCQVSSVKPSIVPAEINWNNYGASLANPDIAVNINFQIGGVRPPIDLIKAVLIDNTGCDYPVFVFFPDSRQVVTCPPNAILQQQVMTNQLSAVIYGADFTDAVAVDFPRTLIQFSNVPFIPFASYEQPSNIPLYLSSPTITRGNFLTPGYAPPALGDQMSYSLLLLQASYPAPTSSVVLWDTPRASGYIYLTSLFLGVSSYGGANNQMINTIFNDQGDILFEVNWQNTTFAAQPGMVMLFNQSGLQIKLDATREWRIKNFVGITTGYVNVISSYTYTDR